MVFAALGLLLLPPLGRVPVGYPRGRKDLYFINRIGRPVHGIILGSLIGRWPETFSGKERKIHLRIASPNRISTGQGIGRASARESLCLDGLSEGDPESVDVANAEFAHAIEGIVNVYHEFRSS